ncbi:MAG TPA: aminoglycoside phosphotransferase family protein [Alphaproteobacteria bacterium]|nr:aminoglycoside phosphotransferase family protein [Alphaproteobacteria bacterium]
MRDRIPADAFDVTPALAALRALPAFRNLAPDALEPAGFAGMAHDHLRLKGLGLVLRIPRVSQWALPAAVNLAYQAAAFRRAAPSGHTPRLYAVLPPSEPLPMGALLVEEIVGRKPRLPDDLPALAACLRAVHGLPLPHPQERRPLLSPDDPLGHVLRTIETQATFLGRAGRADEAEAMLREELAWARHFVTAAGHPPAPTTLILTDSHPGNFVIDAAGKAHFVDLEKAMYANPAIDLAHATLYTSTRFDPDIDTALTAEETAAFYRDYLGRIGIELREALRPWLLPLRRLVWLRTTTWCAKWRVESAGTDGWSRLRLDPRTRVHTEACIADFFAPATIARIRAEWLQGGGPMSLG